MIKILHTEASPGWGGQEMRILKESLGMKRRGYGVVLAVEQGSPLATRARQEGIEVFEFKFRKIFWPFSFLKLIWLIKKNDIDIVNTHSSLDAWLAGAVAKLLRVPVIRTRHLSTAIRPGLNSVLLYNRLANFVVTTCSSIVPVICRQARLDPVRCASIPTGVDTDLMFLSERPSFKRKMGIKDTEILVGTACFMRSWKGIGDFLKAASLLKQDKDLRWIIIGGGHAERYVKMAKELDLDNVIFVGHLEDPFFAISALDIFLLLSTAHEGVSQAILQAALLEKPLVATPTGGLSEVCLDGLTGIQVPCFSSEKIKDAVLELKDNPQLRRKMGKAGKRLVEDKFTFKIMLDRMECVYKKVLKLS